LKRLARSDEPHRDGIMKTRQSTNAFTLLAGVGIGAVLMYFFDPDRGTRRRHMVADQTARSLRKAARRFRDQAENARNHVRGTAAEFRARRRRGDVDDDVLVERVRAELGHHVRHTSAIEVSATGGRVILSGPVLAAELDDVLTTIAGVRGVRGVENLLDVHESAEVSALQG
jgi:osmotically-inducible protein OsmY